MFPPNVLRWMLTIFIVFVYGITLFFMYLEVPQSRYIFTTQANWIGVQAVADYGPFVYAVFEVLAMCFLLLPATHGFGALISLFFIGFVLTSHLLTPVGMVIPTIDAVTGQVLPIVEDGGDTGSLFMVACLVFFSSAFLLRADRYNENGFFNQIKRKKNADPIESA